MHAVIATGVLLGLAASLSGCGPGGPKCPAVEGPTKTIDFTPEGEVILIDMGEDFDAEVTTLEGSTASVTVQVAESLEKNIKIQYNDHTVHGGSKTLSVSMQPALGDVGCSTGVKVTVTLPAPALYFYGHRGTSTIDILTGGASSQQGSLTVGLLNGENTTLSAARRGQLIVNSVEATRLSISDGSIYGEDRLNGVTVHVLDGEVSDSVSITQQVKRSVIELNGLTTQSATIDQSVEEGSLTGMRSQTCSINFAQAGTITTEVSQTVDCTVQGQDSAEGKITITGDAAKTGSCFASAQDVQALV